MCASSADVITFGEDMSPPKVCVENLANGQRDSVPAQRLFCRVATFGGDIGVSPPKSSSPVVLFGVVIERQ